MQATAKDLRFHVKELLEAVGRGEEVVITLRGKPCAKLVPLGRKKGEKGEAGELFGIWKDNKASEDVSGYVRALRRGRL